MLTRFKVREFDGGGHVQMRSMRAWWPFKLEDIIRAWNSDPEYVKSKREAVPASLGDGPNYWGSSEAERQDKWAKENCVPCTFFDTGGTQLSHGRGLLFNLHLEIGGDGVNIFAFGSHTTTVVCVRCSGLPAHLRAQRRFTKPLFIISGDL